MLCDWKMNFKPNEEVSFSFEVGRKQESPKKDGSSEKGEFINEIRFGTDGKSLNFTCKFDPVLRTYGPLSEEDVRDFFARFTGRKPDAV